MLSGISEFSAFIPQPRNITVLWLVLISRPDEGRRLSWPGTAVSSYRVLKSVGARDDFGHSPEHNAYGRMARCDFLFVFYKDSLGLHAAVVQL